MHSIVRFSALTALFAGLAAGPAGAQVGINEVQYDATGTDDGKTFIEIYGPPGFDISGYKILQIEGDLLLDPAQTCGNVNQGGPIVLPSGSLIGPDALFVVADTLGGVTSVVVAATHNGGVADYLVANADFENGPNEAFQLTDPSGLVLDVVAVGAPACTLDVTGQPMLETAAALDVFGGFSLTRFPLGVDSNDNSADFYVNGLPSPGASKPPASLVYSVGFISLAAGGATNLDLTFPTQPNAQYLILASITTPTGSDPLGVPVDPITNAFINLAVLPNPFVVGFAGTLDATGHALGSLTIPAGIASVPFDVPFYFVGLSPVAASGAKSNVANITIGP